VQRLATPRTTRERQGFGGEKLATAGAAIEHARDIAEGDGKDKCFSIVNLGSGAMRVC
jgi:hypothetical protein